jgi:hypothetical protein
VLEGLGARGCIMRHAWGRFVTFLGRVKTTEHGVEGAVERGCRVRCAGV